MREPGGEKVLGAKTQGLYTKTMRWYRVRKRKPTKHYLKHKEIARAFVHARVEEFAQVHGFSYGRIAIRNTRRSWGSCSELGNLNFSYKIIFLPEVLADYVIVHELCHLREFNHSPNYWAHVERILPDYKERRRALAAAARLPLQTIKISM